MRFQFARCDVNDEEMHIRKNIPILSIVFGLNTYDDDATFSMISGILTSLDGAVLLVRTQNVTKMRRFCVALKTAKAVLIGFLVRWVELEWFRVSFRTKLNNSNQILKQHRKNVHKLYDRKRADNLNAEEEDFHKIHTLNAIEI